MPYPWTAALLPEGVLLGLVMAVAGACVGAWLGARLCADREPSAARGGGARRGRDLRADRLRAAVDRRAGRARDGRADVRGRRHGQRRGARRPARRRRRRLLVHGDAWQGGGLVVDRLERIAPGEYRTTEPVPVDRRVEDDDPPAPRQRAERAARSTCPPTRRSPSRASRRASAVERAFGPEQQLLQRERKTDAPGWLWAAAYGVVLLIALGFLVAARLGRAPRVGGARRPRDTVRARRARASGRERAEACELRPFSRVHPRRADHPGTTRRSATRPRRKRPRSRTPVEQRPAGVALGDDRPDQRTHTGTDRERQRHPRSGRAPATRWLARATRPVIAMITSEVATARRNGAPSQSVRTGTITNPPPTPKKPVIMPTSRPARRTGRAAGAGKGRRRR